MPNLYVKDDGVWKPVKRLWVKNSGSWQSPANGYVKQGGAFKRYYPDTVTPVTYSSPGSYTYTVPNGVTSVTVSYMTTSGPASTTRSVTPGGTVSVNIGGYGSGSSFGAFSTSAFSVNVSDISTNVDQNPGLYIDQAVATTSACSYSGSGTQDVIEPGAAAAGIYYNEYGEGNQGDFGAIVTLNTVPISYLTNSYRVAVTSFTGRGSYEITAQPSPGNSYRYTIRIFDPYNSNSNYYWVTTLQQIVALRIS